MSSTAPLWPSIKAGARRRPLRVQLTETDADGVATPIAAITAGVVRFKNSAGETVLEGALVVEDPDEGIVRYEWPEDWEDTLPPGNYALEFRVTVGGLLDILPDAGTLFFVVENPIAAVA